MKVSKHQLKFQSVKSQIREFVETRMRGAKLHAMSDYSAAKREYDDLVDWLGHINHAALQLLEEAQGETLTVTKLSAPPLLKSILSSTNPIESMFSIQKPKVARVKNWRSGPNQVLRWAATALPDAEKRFRKVTGHMHMSKLIESLKTFSVKHKQEVA